MWYVIQCRLHGDDEDELRIACADTEQEACADVEQTVREDAASPLCRVCLAAETPNDAAENCSGDCRAFYVIHVVSCPTAPKHLA